MKKRSFYIFFGPPGSGKGTQVGLLNKKLKLPIFAPGELLRQEAESGSQLGKKIKPLMEKGKILKDEIIEKIADKRLKKLDTARGIIFDGYPRKLAQQKSVIKRLAVMANKDDVVSAILIDVRDKEIIKRLGGRRVCACGELYHVKYKPSKKAGICDKCGQKLLIRHDDKPAVIKERLSEYHKNINPILAYWDKQKKLIKINGEQSIEKIAKDILEKISNL